MVDNAQLAEDQLLTAPQVSTEYEIRVLDSMAEHLASYRLRHEVYATLDYHLRPNDSGLEIDEFDPYSVPVGAFDPASGGLIGILRIVTRTRQPRHERIIRRIVADHGDQRLADLALGPVPHPLPSIVSEPLLRRIEAFNTDQSALYELGRTIVRPEYRGLHVSRGLVTFGIAYLARHGPTTMVGSCLREHLPMYAKYGFALLPYSDADNSFGVTGYLTVGRTDDLPQPTRTHVDELLAAMRSGAADRTVRLGPESRARFALPSRD